VRNHIRSLLLLALAGFFLLEALLWARTATTERQYVSYPSFGMDADGDVQFWRRWYHRRPKSHHIERYYDAERNLLETVEVPINEHGPRRTLLDGHLALREAAVWEGFEHPAFLAGRGRRHRTWSYHLLQSLNQIEARRRDTIAAPIYWVEHEDRIVCIDIRSRDVVEDPGIGFSPGADFTAIDYALRLPLLRYRGILDVGDGSLSFLSVTAMRGEIPGDSPAPVEVTLQPLGIRGAVVAAGRDGALVAQGQTLVLLQADGTIAAASEWEPGEDLYAMRSSSAGNGMVTTLGAVSPTGARLRLRLVSPGNETIVRDIEMRPITGFERTVAFITGLFAVARPLPLNVVSAFSDPPRTVEELCRWWWRDPYFAGGSFAWLAASIAVALLCGWRTRVRARVRSPQHIAFWTFAGILLGPLGLLWMHLVIGRVKVETVDGRSYAVNVEEAPWPEPAPRGTEVFA